MEYGKIVYEDEFRRIRWVYDDGLYYKMLDYPSNTEKRYCNCCREELIDFTELHECLR